MPSGIWKLKDQIIFQNSNEWQGKGQKALIAGGNISPSTKIDTIEFVTIPTTGNSSDFGDLTVARGNFASGGGYANSALAGGGLTPSSVNTVDEITYASSGNAIDWGDLSEPSYAGASMNDDTRSVLRMAWAGSRSTTIQYFDKSSRGSTADFGDAGNSTAGEGGGSSDSIRGLYSGGSVSPTSQVNSIEFITIKSLGNATDFGDLNHANGMRGAGSTSSDTRAIFCGGQFFNSPSPGTTNATNNVIDFVTIQTTGNATDFGDLTQTRQTTAVSSNSVRAVIAGGFRYTTAPSNELVNTIDYITISTTGNAIDFGDLSTATSQSSGFSGGTGAVRAGTPRIGDTVTGQQVISGDRALVTGGNDGSPGRASSIESIEISSQGTATNFGNLTGATDFFQGASNETRAISGGGNVASPRVAGFLDYNTFASRGNAAEYGNLTTARNGGGATMSNSTRGLFAGGYITPASVDTVDYVEFSSTGNVADFGNLNVTTSDGYALSSTTRGVLGGGKTNPANAHTNRIEYFTIASTGNGTDFGDLTTTRTRHAATSSATRGLFAGGYTAGGPISNIIEYITIASTGNSTDFGDLTQLNCLFDGTSNGTRAIFNGGLNPARVNTIETVIIATTGNAADFGDLTVAKHSPGSMSNCHGGLDGSLLPTSTLGRGFFVGGSDPARLTDISFINISSEGNATDFGDLIEPSNGAKGTVGNTTRILVGGNNTNPASANTNLIQAFNTFTTGNAFDFGDKTVSAATSSGASNSVRGLFAGGYIYSGSPSPAGSTTNVIDYITIASIGNAIDFGDLNGDGNNMVGVESPTRAIFAGGATNPAPGTIVNTIRYVEIATTGNTTDFGDMTTTKATPSSGSSNTRALFAGGSPGPQNVIDYITMASTGNAIDFGDLTETARDGGGASNKIRMVRGGGANPGLTNVMDFVTIASTGDATDFGDLLAAIRGHGGKGNDHGGIE